MIDAFEGPRYLVPFGPRRVPHCFTDVLILGGGLAGLRAALEVDPSLSVTVITKDDLRESSSQYAQGGIAGVVDPEDRFDNHVADTLIAGGGLCHAEVVDAVVREAPSRIEELMAWGTRFDERNGELDLGREGGHSHRRIVHALGDATGREVMRAVIERARGLSNLEVWPDTFTIDLLTDDTDCRGALVWNKDHGKTLVWARRTILATGGAGQVYRETTNPDVASGDGMALAWRAGSLLRDMEFMQFHPTVLYIAGGARSLITEAVRGAGAWLVDRDGQRFMPAFDSRAELAPRDIVSRAINRVMQQTHHANVYLDLSHLDAEMVRRRFPGMAKLCAEFGLDLTRDKIPVRPGAHYMIGGVAVDADSRTDLPGLLAAGEVTSSGLHGANRLASNSLLEGLVYGARAGAAASADVLAMNNRDDLRVPMLFNPRRDESHEPLDLEDIRNSLKSMMWRKVGVDRCGESLAEALEAVEGWCRYVLPRQFSEPRGWQLQNMLEVGRLMIRGAIVREETRGVHTRHDFPEAASRWRRHITWQRGIPEHREQAIDGPCEDPTTLPLAAKTTATA
ncbi:MAG: L-aspartate oxidase [Pirellulales bacterium]|nr:L-aspartate oxidase [Pirellulales bacterium]MBL7194151.1 L-aspartate oxidase [Pirellulales bacterium]